MKQNTFRDKMEAQELQVRVGKNAQEVVKGEGPLLTEGQDLGQRGVVQRKGFGVQASQAN